jgi:hypothetical protein
MMTTLMGRSAISLCFFSMFSASVAGAAVTPEDVWENWKSQATASAYEIVTTSTERQGNSLIVEGVEMRQNTALQTGRIVMGRLEFRDLGNGTVQVIVPETYAMTMSSPETPEATGTMRQVAPEIIVSGTPESMRHDIKMASFEMLFDTTVPDDEEGTISIVIGVEGAEGHMLTEGRTVENVTYDMKATRGRVSIKGEGDTEFNMDLNAEAVAMVGEMSSIASVAKLANPDDIGKALADGLAMKGTITAGASTIGIFATDPEGAGTNIDLATTGAGAEFGMSKAGMIYGLRADGLDLTISGDTIPMPEVTATMTEANMRFDIPLTKGDAPQNFNVLTRLVDLALPDDIWAMVDPMQMLPRVPATLIVDVGGKVKLISDLMDPPAEDESIPGELQALDLRELQVKLIGADLTGTGAFTFDNTDLETFGGMPRPTGAIDLKLIGGNALLDKAIAMGLIPQDEAMGYRMMMALFARPGEGEDTLVSKIEVTPEGAVLANGQRIQ